MRQLSKRVFKAVKASLPNAHVECIVICTKTCHKVKELSLEIVRTLKIAGDDLPFPLLPPAITTNWFTANKLNMFSLREQIIATQEEISDASIESLIIQKSILTWPDFVALCAQHQLTDDIELVALFLRHIGILHHYRDVPKGQNSFSDLVFLQPDS